MTGSWRYRQRRYKHLRKDTMTHRDQENPDLDRCHICGQMRPKQVLAVETHKTVMPGSNEKVLEKVLYCSDKAECTAAAPTFSFVTPKPSALDLRNRRGLGE